MEVRICNTCGIEKSLIDFPKRNGWYKHRCIPCEALTRKEYEEKRRTTPERQEYMKQYRPKYYLKNIDKIKTKVYDWKKLHKEETKVKMTIYYENHKEEIEAYKSNWRADNPEKIQATRNRRRARKAQTPQNDLTGAQWLELQVAFNPSLCLLWQAGQRSSDPGPPDAIGAQWSPYVA